MPKKTFPGQEILKFDSERNCMMLRDGEVETPVINWHNYTRQCIVETIENDDPEITTTRTKWVRGQIKGSFVAMLMTNHEEADIVVIGHSVVHPSDAHKAFKAHGRTVAAKRLAKAVTTPKYSFTEYATLTGETARPVMFLLLDVEARNKMDIRNPEFLPAVYRRLLKLDSKSPTEEKDD